MSAQHKPKVTPTIVVDLEDEALAAPFGVNLQFMDVWKVHSDARKTMLFDSCPHVCNILDVTPWDFLKTKLVMWKQDTSYERSVGCFDIMDPKWTSPPCAVMDKLCPVPTVVEQLHRADWNPHQCYFEHRDSTKALG